MRRWVAQAGLIIAVVLAGVPAVAKQPAVVELFYNGVWNDHTADLYRRDSIAINHAILDGQTGLAPSDASLTFQNRDGKMNPDNRLSSLYGLIGHNTPMRIKVTPDVRFSGRIMSWNPQRSKGTTKFDAWVEVKAQGNLKRLGEGTPPEESASHRTILASDPVGAWMMQDGSEAVSFASALPGGAPMAITTGATPGETSPVHWIPAMAKLAITPGAVGTMRATITGAQATGDVAMAFGWQRVEGTESFSQVVVETANGIRWRVTIDDLFNELVVQALDGSGPIGGGGGWSTSLVDGGLHHVMATIHQNGANATIHIYVDGVDLSLSSSTVSTVTVAAPVAAEVGWQPGTPPPTQQAGTLRMGSLAVWDSLPTATTISGALHGFVGEKAGDRFTRLGQELGIATTIVGSAAETQPMGPQPTDTSLGLLGEIARTDKGMIFDTRESDGLTLRTGRGLNNQTASLTLHWSAGHIGDPLLPKLDNAGRVNVVVARQRNGSEVTDSDVTGKLGTAAIGTYKQPAEVNLASEAELALHAHYALVLGTDPDPRYSKIVVDLDANPTLAAAASAVNAGSLVALSGIPAELGQPEAETLALGYQEVIGSHRRVIAFNSGPGTILSHLGKLNSNGGLQTAGAQLDSAITASQSGLLVATTAPPSFTTSPPTSAKIIVRDREVMPVVAISSAAKDTFTRTLSNDWGTPDIDGPWSLSGGTLSNFAVNGTKGTITLPTGDTASRVALLPGAYAYTDLVVTISASAVATGASINGQSRFRSIDSNNYYVLSLAFDTAGTVDVSLLRVLAGSTTGLGSLANAVSYSAGSDVFTRVLAVGSDLRAKVWTTGGEPAAWTLTATDASHAAGQVGVRAVLSPGNTNVNPVLSFDNFEVANPQLFTVSRDPQQAMGHAAGSSVRVYRPLRLTL